MKNAKGHGSNGRGVTAVQARNDRMHAMFERARVQKAAEIALMKEEEEAALLEYVYHGED